MSSLSLRQIKFSYDAFHLSDCTLEIKEGETAALLGASGSGKSTVLRLIAGFLKPQAGEIYLGDTCVASPSQCVPAHKRNIGLVFQSYALFPHMTVRENILFGCQKSDSKKREILLQEWLERLDIAPLAARWPHQISGGEQQRVALARALIASPRLLLMDEPFANLNTELREQVRKECHHIIVQQGITTLLVTHDRGEAAEFASKIYSLSDGKLSTNT